MGQLNYDLSNLNVLLVEDNEFTQRLHHSILGALGIRQIRTATDGATAYEMFQTAPFDLIIVDWQMEPVNGPTFIRRIRQDEGSPNPYVPIMMITSYSEIGNVFTARDAGVNEFLAKPVSAAQIYGRLVRILENTRPFVKTKSYFGPDRRRRNDPKYNGEERRTNKAKTGKS